MKKISEIIRYPVVRYYLYFILFVTVVIVLYVIKGKELNYRIFATLNIVAGLFLTLYSSTDIILPQVLGLKRLTQLKLLSAYETLFLGISLQICGVFWTIWEGGEPIWISVIVNFFLPAISIWGIHQDIKNLMKKQKKNKKSLREV